MALHVGGSIGSVGDAGIEIADGATLDLYVAGDVGLIGDASVGGDRSAFRLYVGGSGEVALGSVGSLEIAGLIYAPDALVSTVGDTHVDGSVVARALSNVGELSITHAPPAAPDPEACEEPEAAGDGEGAAR